MQRRTSSFGTTIAQFFTQGTGKSLVASLLPKRRVHCERIPGPSDDDQRRRPEQPHLHLCKSATHSDAKSDRTEKNSHAKTSVGDPFCRRSIDEPFTSPFSSQIQEEFLKGASDYANWLRTFASQSSSSQSGSHRSRPGSKHSSEA